jgi:hypothetical protein
MNKPSLPFDASVHVQYEQYTTDKREYDTYSGTVQYTTDKLK